MLVTYYTNVIRKIRQIRELIANLRARTSSQNRINHEINIFRIAIKIGLRPTNLARPG